MDGMNMNTSSRGKERCRRCGQGVGKIRSWCCRLVASAQHREGGSEHGRSFLFLHESAFEGSTEYLGFDITIASFEGHHETLYLCIEQDGLNRALK